MKKIMLDTNTYAKYILGDPAVLAQIIEADKIYLSSVVIGELIAGFLGGSQINKNRDNLNKFISKSTVQVLAVGVETSEIYAELKNDLKRKGTPIPTNDIWIAACAVENGAKLITYDKHFLNIQGLRLWEEIKK
ncbi:MAG: type II toxin-antitoxin system VapC family toxin [Ignavibacteria bacterium]